jgi:hypothetical protein
MSIFMVNDFSGSTNQHTAPHLLANNQSPFDLNIIRDEDGAIAHRFGSSLLAVAGSGGSKVQGMGIYHDSDGNEIPCVIVNGNFYAYDEDDEEFDLVSSNVVATSSTVDFTEYIGRLYFIGSGNAEYLKYYDGSSISTVSGDIQGQYLTQGNNRLLAGGGLSADAPRRIFFSNAGTDTFTTGSDFLDLDEPVTGLAVLGESNPFVAFGRSTTYVFDPNTSYSKKISEDIGCTSHRTIGSIQSHVIFLSLSGIYRFSANEAYPIKISTLVENETETNGFFNKIPESGFNSASAIVLRNKYFLSVGDLSGTIGGETLNDFMFVFDIKQLVFSHRNYKANDIGSCFSRYLGKDGTEKLIAGGRNSGGVFVMDEPGTYNDVDENGTGSAVEAIYRSKHFEFSTGSGKTGIETTKIVQAGFLKFFSDKSLTINFSKNGAETYTSWTNSGTTPSGDSWSWDRYSPFSDSNFKTLSFEVRGTGKWKIYAFGLDLSGKAHAEIPSR